MFTRSIALLLVIASTSCSRDPNVTKIRYLQNGNKYFERGKYKEAFILYRTALQKDAKFGEAHYRLALTELKLEQPAAAIGSLRRAVELLEPGRPEQTDALIKLADAYLNFLDKASKREKEVVDEVRRINSDLIKADPKSLDGHRLQGRLYFVLAEDAAGRHEIAKMKEALQSAIAEFKIANSLKPDQTDVVVYLARALTANQQADEAEKLYGVLVEREKENLQPYTELYRMYMFQNQPERAEAILKKAIANNPKKYELLINLAQHYYGRGRRDDVVQVLESLQSHGKEYPAAFEQEGAFYIRLGEPAQAIRKYEDGIKANPARKIFYQKRIIEVLVAQGKREEAKKINETILHADPQDTDALGRRAAFLLDRGDLQNAAPQLQTVVARAPGNFVAHYDLGRALAQKGQLELARAQFDEAIRLRPDYVGARLALAQVQLSTNEFDKALKTADDTLAYDPNNTTAHLVRASAYMGLNQLSEAEWELKQLLDKSPKSQEAMLRMGLALTAEKRFKEAEDFFRRCYELDPRNPSGLLGMTDAMVAQKQPDRAAEILRSEIQKYPARREFHMALANVYARAGKFDLAISEFNGLLEKVDHKSADAADIYFRLGETQRLAQRLPAAIDAMQKARDILPGNATILNALVSMLTVAGRKNEARTACENALRVDSENPIALNNLAYVIAESAGGDLNEALTFAQRANRKLPQQPDIADTLGWIYLKKNLPDNALEIFQANVARAPANARYRYHLGMALYQKGDKAHAKQELQTALTNGPSKEEAENIRELIGKI